MWTNQKSFLWFQKKWHIIPFCCCCNYATVGHIGMRIFNFVVLPVITAPNNVSTPHISKTHLPIVSLNVHELELNWCSKNQSKKKGGRIDWGVEAQLPLPLSFKIYWMELLLFIQVCVFRVRLKRLASDAWAEMSWNELQWTQMSSKELECV